MGQRPNVPGRRRRWILIAVPCVLLVVLVLFVLVLHRSGPPAHLGSYAYWDPATESLYLLAAGYEPGTEGEKLRTRPSLWQLSERKWVKVSDCAGLSPVRAAAFDPERGKLVCLTEDDGLLTGIWDGSLWRIIPSEELPSDLRVTHMFYNPRRAFVEIVDFVACRRFTFANERWVPGPEREITPPPQGFRYREVLYDAFRNRFVFLGSEDDASQLDDLACYAYSDGMWDEISIEDPLRYMFGYQFALDTRRKQVLVVSDMLGHESSFRISRVADEILSGVSSSNAPDSRIWPTIAYHPGYDGILLHGGYTSPLFWLSPHRDTWLARYIEEEDRFDWERLN